MGKIINTLKYGDKEVKRVLLGTVFAGLISAGLFVTAVILSNIVFFFAGLIAVFATISLAQTMGIKDSESNKPRPIGEAYNQPVRDERVNMGQEEDPYEVDYESVYGPAEEQTAHVIPEQSIKADNSYDTMFSEVESESYSDMDELSQVVASDKKTKKRKGKKKKVKIKKEKIKKEKQAPSFKPIEEKNVKMQVEPVEKKQEKKDEIKNDKSEDKKIEQITAEDIKSYNKKKIKKTLYKFKVKRDHRMVMVDRADKYNIKQTPAYIWKTDNSFHILLIEKEPRMLTLPLYMLNQITYLKKQPVNENADYGILKGAGGLLYDLFKPYLPEYTRSTVVNDMTSYKNLYGIGPGIYFTNTSAKHLFDLLAADFFVEDKVTTSNKVNIYFKEAYKANIKLRDSVLDANGYADSISIILDNLAHSTMSYNEFKETLSLMIKNRLITEEFAGHYIEVRNKIGK